jgi:hypothetical protein
MKKRAAIFAAAAPLLAVLVLAGCAGGPGPARPAALAPSAPDLPGEEVVAVEADGEANVIPGNRLNTREMALSSAQKNAIEKAVGVLVSGQMVVSQARLIEDQVYSKSAGYLKSWDVLTEKEEDGLYTIRIKARVKMGDMRKDLDGLGMMIKTKKVGNPRVMILVDEKIDGKPSESKTVETGLAAQLLDKGYKVVDADQLAEIRNQEKTLKAISGDLVEAAELGKRFGAEIALVGTIDAKLFAGGGKGDPAAGVALGDMFSYRGRLNLKAVKTSSGQMVLAVSKEGTGMDITQENAASRCLADLSEVAGGELSEKLAPALWESAEVQIAISGVKDFETMQKIVAAVRACDGVRNVVTRSFAAGEAVLDTELYGGNANTLSAQLEGRSKLPIEIKEVAAYRITAVLGALQ